MIHQTFKPGTLHDSFCRCRVCKPPLVGETSQARRARDMFGIAMMAIVVWGLIVLAAIALFGHSSWA